LNPIDGGCRIVSADVYEKASPKFQAAGNRPFDRKVREAAQLTAIPTFVNYKRSSAHNVDFETVITTNLEKLSELDRQDTTSGHVCEAQETSSTDGRKAQESDDLKLELLGKKLH